VSAPPCAVWIRCGYADASKTGNGAARLGNVNGCLLAAGGVVTVAALVLMAFTGWFVFAMLSLLVGVPALVGGIVLTIDAKRRKSDRD